MKRQRGFIGEILFIIIILCVVALIDSYSCRSRWSDTGVLEVSWGPFQGCKVKLPDGRWMPEDRIREVDVIVTKENSKQ